MGSQTGHDVNAASLFNVDGMVALVTGGGSGIGLMMTKALAHNGAAKVYIAGRRLEVLEAAASATGPNVIPIQCDVTSKESLAAAADRIRQDAGFINLLICNSGIGGPQVKPITDETSAEEWAASNLSVDFEDYNRTFSVNTTSVWYTAMTFLPLLDAGNKKGNLQQTSQVLVTSSIAAFNKHAPGGYAYGQSKAAVNHVVKHLSVALPKWKIRANSIAPGLFPSDMSGPIVQKFTDDAGETRLPKEMVPLERMGDEKDMAGTVLYYASRAGAYCNGVISTVDGGRLANFSALY